MAVVFFAFLLLVLTNPIASYNAKSSTQGSAYGKTKEHPTSAQYFTGDRQNFRAVENSYASSQYKTVDYDVSYNKSIINRCRFRNSIIISCETINKKSSLNQNKGSKGRQNPVIVEDKAKRQNPVDYDDIYSNGNNRKNTAYVSDKNGDSSVSVHASRTKKPVKVENTKKGQNPNDDIVINIGNGKNRENTVFISQKKGAAPDTIYANTYEKNGKPNCLTRNGRIVRPGHGDCEELNSYYPNEYSDSQSQSGINFFKERIGSNIFNIGNGRNNDNIVSLTMH